MGVRAATGIFSRIMDSVVHARMIFFETTPTGRILNRFTSDTEQGRGRPRLNSRRRSHGGHMGVHVSTRGGGHMGVTWASTSQLEAVVTWGPHGRPRLNSRRHVSTRGGGHMGATWASYLEGVTCV
eukprot:1251784-Prymnesium_polylepis.1